MPNALNWCASWATGTHGMKNTVKNVQQSLQHAQSPDDHPPIVFRSGWTMIGSACTTTAAE